MSESSSTPHPDGVRGAWRPYRVNRAAPCPYCGSTNTQTKDHGKRIGGALGTCVGAISALSSAVTPTSSLSGVTAAVLGALASGAVGCASGAALGVALDETVLNNHRCLRCFHSFQTP